MAGKVKRNQKTYKKYALSIEHEKNDEVSKKKVKKQRTLTNSQSSLFFLQLLPNLF